MKFNSKRMLTFDSVPGYQNGLFDIGDPIDFQFHITLALIERLRPASRELSIEQHNAVDVLFWVVDQFIFAQIHGHQRSNHLRIFHQTQKFILQNFGSQILVSDGVLKEFVNEGAQQSGPVVIAVELESVA